MALVRFQRVSKTYPEGDDFVQALDGASLSIREGEFIAVMGPSGSGKSTLLSVLGVLNTPSEGEVFIDETAVYSLPPERRADFRFTYLGFVFQSFQLIPYLNALENVMTPLSISKMASGRQREAAAEALRMVGLEGKENRLPNQISGGEIQRVAVARAVVNNPPVLLADEPTGNLDSKNAQEIMRLLEKLNDAGKTIVMVTHDEGMAGYADRTIRLEDGVVC